MRERERMGETKGEKWRRESKRERERERERMKKRVKETERGREWEREAGREWGRKRKGELVAGSASPLSFPRANDCPQSSGPKDSSLSLSLSFSYLSFSLILSGPVSPFPPSLVSCSYSPCVVHSPHQSLWTGQLNGPERDERGSLSKPVTHQNTSWTPERPKVHRN